MSAIDECLTYCEGDWGGMFSSRDRHPSLDAAKTELEMILTKAAFADAMWHHLDTINRPLDEYEGQWYVEYDEKVKP